MVGLDAVTLMHRISGIHFGYFRPFGYAYHKQRSSLYRIKSPDYGSAVD